MEKRNSLIAIILISGFLLINVLFALWNFGTFNIFWQQEQRQRNEFTFRVNMPRMAQQDMDKSKDEMSTTTKAPTPTLGDEVVFDGARKSTNDVGELAANRIKPVRFSFTKMIRYFPLKKSGSGPFQNMPPLDSLLQNRPAMDMSLDPFSMPLPSEAFSKNGPMSGEMGHFVNHISRSMLPNIDELVKDLADRERPDSSDGPFGYPPPAGCIVCTFELDPKDSLPVEIEPENNQPDQPKLTEVKAVLPDSVIPGEDDEFGPSKNRVRGTLMIMIKPKKHGSSLFGDLPPFLPPMFHNHKPSTSMDMSFSPFSPIRDFSPGISPASSFPFREPGGHSERDLMSFITQQLVNSASSDMDNPYDDPDELSPHDVQVEPLSDIRLDTEPIRNSMNKPKLSSTQKPKPFTVDFKNMGKFATVSKSNDQLPKVKLQKHLDAVPALPKFDFGRPMAKTGDDIEKYATIEEVPKTQKPDFRPIPITKTLAKVDLH